ncbi:hypothetical protein GOP47_0007760 [Adiantum capillus-veneris]|uniref:Uncharacterized protein n=1 Tax=Adiantum capillus-veneris TaxID=13818 RepID=A0A9D4ZLU3_ADICA|nr:hypothetical protein GOP47_0007760 [Adiantum capillus-veneris]
MINEQKISSFSWPWPANVGDILAVVHEEGLHVAGELSGNCSHPLEEGVLVANSGQRSRHPQWRWKLTVQHEVSRKRKAWELNTRRI